MQTTVNEEVVCPADSVDCSASATFDLEPGGYVIEAQATFQPFVP